MGVMAGAATAVRPDRLSGADAVLRISEQMVRAESQPIAAWADDDLVGAVERWEAAEAIAAAQKQRMMAEMAHRMVAEAERLEFPRPDGSVRREALREATNREIGWCAAEFAPVLRLSQYSAKQRVEESIDMLGPLHTVWAALNRGAFTRLHAHIFREELDLVEDPEKVARIIAEHVDAAGGYAPAELREALRHAVLKADPEAAARRHRWSRSNRYVTAEMVEDAMGLLRARLTADELTAVMGVIDAYARLAPPDDPRTLDQRRASVLVDLVTGGLPNDPREDAADPYLFDPPADLSDASDDEVVAAFEERLAREAADSAAEHAEADIQAEIDSGEAAKDVVRIGRLPKPRPGDPRPAPPPDGPTGGPVPSQPTGPEPSQPSGPEPSQPSDPEPSQPSGGSAAEAAAKPGRCTCGGRDPFAGAAFGVQSRVGVDVKIITTAETLLGLDDLPAYLDGYGHVHADLARRLAADGALSRLLVEPDTSALIDVGHRTYRPSAALRSYVTTRDRTCRVAGCRCRIAELDHVVPFPEGDTTRANLAGDCKFHHLWKTFAGIDVQMDPDGTCTWTTQTGRRYQTKPPPIGGVCPPTTRLSPARRPERSVFPDEPPF